MERGIRRQEIFREETDYYIFIAILKNVMEKYRQEVPDTIKFL